MRLHMSRRGALPSPPPLSAGARAHTRRRDGGCGVRRVRLNRKRRRHRRGAKRRKRSLHWRVMALFFSPFRSPLRLGRCTPVIPSALRMPTTALSIPCLRRKAAADGRAHMGAKTAEIVHLFSFFFFPLSLSLSLCLSDPQAKAQQGMAQRASSAARPSRWYKDYRVEGGGQPTFPEKTASPFSPFRPARKERRFAPHPVALACPSTASRDLQPAIAFTTALKDAPCLAASRVRPVVL